MGPHSHELGAEHGTFLIACNKHSMQLVLMRGWVEKSGNAVGTCSPSKESVTHPCYRICMFHLEHMPICIHAVECVMDASIRSLRVGSVAACGLRASEASDLGSA